MIQRLIDWLLRWLAGDHKAQGIIGFEGGKLVQSQIDAQESTDALDRENHAAAKPSTDSATEDNLTEGQF